VLTAADVIGGRVSFGSGPHRLVLFLEVAIDLRDERQRDDGVVAKLTPSPAFVRRPGLPF
jgi:hypothetical protein